MAFTFYQRPDDKMAYAHGSWQAMKVLLEALDLHVESAYDLLLIFSPDIIECSQPADEHGMSDGI